MNYRDLMVELRRSAILAGDRIMEIYEADDFEVRSKSDDSPVTAADEAADALIAERSARRVSRISCCVTEEQADSHDLNAPSFLIVDPLDGTKEFVKRRGEFTVNIALCRRTACHCAAWFMRPRRVGYSTRCRRVRASRKCRATPALITKMPGEVSRALSVRHARQRRADGRGVEIPP
jgi:3'-phosphoadenosine 5'-phosphosulfate (PAPS) 3'-phosphatase